MGRGDTRGEATGEGRGEGRGQRWRSLGLRLVVLATLWWAVSEANPEGLSFGVPVVAVALGASLVLSPPRPGPRVSLPGLLRFIGFFLVMSVRAGLDVAWRALHPRVPMSPALVRYPIRLRAPVARSLFMFVLNQMPGTFQADLEGDSLWVHVLVDREGERHPDVEEIERRVADVFPSERLQGEQAHG